MAAASGTEEKVKAHMLKCLDGVKVSSLDLSQDPIVLDAATDPKKALEVLIENKIIAAPVFEKGKYIGVFDLRDSVKHALAVYHKGTIDKAKAKAMQFLAISPHITTNTLAYLSRMRQFATVKEDDPVLNVIKHLARGHHIVGVLSADGKGLKTILTQGSVFQQVSKHWKFGGGIVPTKAKTEKKESDPLDVTLNRLKELKFVASPVKSVKGTMKAHEAFDMMTKSGLSGLAVVDENGKLIHNTSATDIKLWLIASHSLEETIEQFLIEIRKLSLVERYPITMCHMSDGLSKAISKLQATKYHRLWVVDAETRPIGVLALTDIFRFMTS